MGPAHLEIVEVSRASRFLRVACGTRRDVQGVPLFSAGTVLVRKAKFMAICRNGRAVILALAGIGLLCLVQVRCQCGWMVDAVVAPGKRAVVATGMLKGNRKSASPRREPVQRGQVLAEMRDGGSGRRWRLASRVEI